MSQLYWGKKAKSASDFCPSSVFPLGTPTMCSTMKRDFFELQKGKKAGDGVTWTRALLSRRCSWTCSSVPVSDHVKTLGTHSCRGRTPQTVFWGSPQILYSVLQREGMLGLFKHISKRSAKHRRSIMDYQKLILLLAFCAVTFERSPGAA